MLFSELSKINRIANNTNNSNVRMSISNINKKLITLGTGLIGSIKYEINYNYCVFDFFKLQEDKKLILENKLEKFLCK